MTLDDLLKGLNENQRRAVESTEGRVRVAAGAGSGKTRVLTLRYAYIVQKLGVTPEHILSVTFTNKAAREMRDRIRALMPDRDGGWILTFHGACHKILKEEIGFFAYPENFMVMDEEDQKSVLQRIFSQKGFTLKDFSFRDCMNAIEEYKAFADYVPFLTDVKRAQKAPALDEEKNKLDAVIAAYLDMQRKNYWLDFADLIQFTLYLFKVSKAALQKWQNKFEYVQIDEFQDVSGEQYKLARALAGKHKNLFIVGDPDQTIYSWRGADVGFFNNFDKFFSDAKTIVLDENYRSTPEILAVSNALISKNEDRIEKSLKATRPHGEKPLYHHAKSRIDEADAIADKILELKKTGVSLSDIAVLYRGNYLSRVIETSFVKKRRPLCRFQRYGVLSAQRDKRCPRLFETERFRRRSVFRKSCQHASPRHRRDAPLTPARLCRRKRLLLSAVARRACLDFPLQGNGRERAFALFNRRAGIRRRTRPRRNSRSRPAKERIRRVFAPERRSGQIG